MGGRSQWKLQWMKDLENTTPSCYALLLADNDGDMTVLRLVLVPAYPRAEANATMVTTFSRAAVDILLIVGLAS